MFVSKIWLSAAVALSLLAGSQALATEPVTTPEPATEAAQATTEPAVDPAAPTGEPAADPATTTAEPATDPATADAAPATDEEAAPPNLLAVNPGDRVLGNRDAPVTIIEFSSLTCPHCGAFHRETLPELKAQYIDTGKVNYIIRHFPLDGVALQAAALADCMPEDRYFAFIDTLYINQDKWAVGEDPMRAVVQLARLSGMAMPAIEACLANEENINAVINTRLRGDAELDVNSTPTFFINGQRVKGAQPFADMAAIIDPLLTQ